MKSKRQLSVGVIEYRAGFARRFRMMLACFSSSLKDISSADRGTHIDAFSVMQTERSKLVSFAALSRITEFAVAHQINLHWLFTGRGPMELAAPDCHRGLVPVSESPFPVPFTGRGPMELPTPDCHRGLVPVPESRIPNPESRPSGGPPQC